MNEIVQREQTIDVTGELPVLFKLGLKALIKAKSDALFNLRDLELGILNAKQELAVKERNLLLTTDFKELGLTNEKMRNAFVNEQLNDDKIKIAVQQHRITTQKDDIEIINDLIKLNELELQGE